MAVVDNDSVGADADQARRKIALDLNAAVIGNVEPISLGKDAFGKECEIICGGARRVHRPKVYDPSILALHENAGGAETARLDASKIRDHYVIGVGKDAVCEVTFCRQVPKVENTFSGCAGRQRIFVDA